jgi:hypothetical protein
MVAWNDIIFFDTYSGDITGIAWAPRTILNGKDMAVIPYNSLCCRNYKGVACICCEPDHL